MLGQILGGLALLALGITLFLSREWIYGGVLTMIVVSILSLAACLAGVEVLYEALTGRDFPLHYARWSDRWPF